MGTAVVALAVWLFPNWRQVYLFVSGMVVEPIWGLGTAVVALAAWLFPNWRHYHIATALPIFLVIFVVFIFPPDSLPWLMMNGKHGMAKKFVKC